MATTFYIDETGYTGEDLLNPEQPVFAQAALDFTDSEADSLLHTTFSGVATAELKFNRLSRNPRHQNRIVELVRLIASQHAFRRFRSGPAASDLRYPRRLGSLRRTNIEPHRRSW